MSDIVISLEGVSAHSGSDVPPCHAGHPLVKNCLYFTLPPSLLSEIKTAVGTDRFDPQLLRLEEELGEAHGNHTDKVGFWGSRSIKYNLVRRERFQLTDEMAAGMGYDTPAKKVSFLETANFRTNLFIDTARGYCGWLLTNPAFRQEHDEVFRVWKEQVARHGLPQGEMITYARRDLPSGFRKTQGSTTEYAEAFDAFCLRWRLTSLTGPFLPVPFTPQMPVIHLPSVLGQMQHGGTIFFLPDIYPIPSRDELRVILEDCAGRDAAPEHLREWHEIAQSNNTGKNAIGRFARLFELQHFWRALHTRHADALRRATGKLEQVFAEFLFASVDTIHKDLAFIAGKLGEEWAASNSMNKEEEIR